jgi:hypothetical protein
LVNKLLSLLHLSVKKDTILSNGTDEVGGLAKRGAKGTEEVTFLKAE